MPTSTTVTAMAMQTNPNATNTATGIAHPAVPQIITAATATSVGGPTTSSAPIGGVLQTLTGVELPSADGFGQDIISGVVPRNDAHGGKSGTGLVDVNLTDNCSVTRNDPRTGRDGKSSVGWGLEGRSLATLSGEKKQHQEGNEEPSARGSFSVIPGSAILPAHGEFSFEVEFSPSVVGCSG